MTINDFRTWRVAAMQLRLLAGICAAVLVTGASAGAESAVDSAVGHPDRSEADIARDKGRKPADVLAFFEVHQGMRVIEIGSGGGYYSELLSRVVGDDGFVYAHNPYVFLKLAGDQLTGRYGNGTLRNVGLVFGSLPQLGLPSGTLDGAYLIDIYHDISFDDETGESISPQALETLREAYRLLKPGGIVGVIDHRARKGSTRADAATVHRIPEHMVRRDFQDAGFVFEANTELLRNAADDGSRAWFSDSALKDATDRMVLRFRKPGRVSDASRSFDAGFSYAMTDSKEI